MRICVSKYGEIGRETMLKKLSNKRKQYWEESNLNLTPEYLFELYNGSCIGKENKVTDDGVKSKIWINNSCLSIKNSIAIFKALGFKTYPKNSEEYKKAIIDFYHKQDFSFKLKFIENIIKHFSVLRITSNLLTTGASYKKYNKFFDKRMGFKPKIAYSSRINGPMSITGSFFIDGRWIHVG